MGEASDSRGDSGCSRLSRPADRTARPEPERGRSLPGAVQELEVTSRARGSRTSPEPTAVTQSSVLNYRDWNYKYIFYFNCLRLFWRVSLVRGVWLIYTRAGSGLRGTADPARSPSPRVKTTRTLHCGTLIPALVVSSVPWPPGENPLPTAPQVRPRCVGTQDAWGRLPCGLCPRGARLHLRAFRPSAGRDLSLRPRQVLFCSRRVTWEDVPGGTCHHSQHWARSFPVWW